MSLLGAVWVIAAIGIFTRLALPGQFVRTAYAALSRPRAGACLAALETVAQAVPAASVRLLFAGGILYSAGVAFHLWQRLPFHNAIWHAFVLGGLGLSLRRRARSATPDAGRCGSLGPSLGAGPSDRESGPPCLSCGRVTGREHRTRARSRSGSAASPRGGRSRRPSTGRLRRRAAGRSRPAGPGPLIVDHQPAPAARPR